MKPRTFKVVFEPDEGGWHTYVPELKGCRTWGRSLVAARKNIREAISLCEEELGDAEAVAASAVLDEEFRLPKAVSAALDARTAANAEAVEAAEAARKANVRAAQALTKTISLRDAGDLLGLSHERVKQLAAGVEVEAKRRRTNTG